MTRNSQPEPTQEPRSKCVKCDEDFTQEVRIVCNYCQKCAGEEFYGTSRNEGGPERSSRNTDSITGNRHINESAALGGWISPATSRTGPFNGGGHKRGDE